MTTTSPTPAEPERAVYVQPNQTPCQHPGAGWLDGGVPGRKYEWSCDVCEGKVKPLTLAEIGRWQGQIGKMMARLSEQDTRSGTWAAHALENARYTSEYLDQIERAIRGKTQP